MPLSEIRLSRSNRCGRSQADVFSESTWFKRYPWTRLFHVVNSRKLMQVVSQLQFDFWIHGRWRCFADRLFPVWHGRIFSAICVFLTPGLVAQVTGLCVLSFSIRTRSVCVMRLARVVNTPLRHCSLLQLSFFELCSVRFETPLSGSAEQSSTRQRQEMDPPEDPSRPSTSSSSKQRSPMDMREPPEPRQARYLSSAEREDSTPCRQTPSEVKRSV